MQQSQSKLYQVENRNIRNVSNGAHTHDGMQQVEPERQREVYLDNRHLHEAHAVVRQQLHFDSWRTHKRQ